MAHERSESNRSNEGIVSEKSQLLTVDGQGTPTSFEITVDGRIEMDGANHLEEATIVAGSSVQGAIESGVQRFRFDGELTDVTILNRGGDGAAVVDPEFYVE